MNGAVHHYLLLHERIERSIMNFSSHLQEIMSKMTAKMLLEINAFNFLYDEPFRFTSGWDSQVFIDCQKISSYPHIRQTIIDFATSLILQDFAFESFDAVAGGVTAGIPFRE